MLKACQKNYKCFKCNVRHSNSICTFVPKASSCKSGQEYSPEDSNTLYQLQINFKGNFRGDNPSTNSLTLLSQNSVLLRTVRAKLSSADERYSRNLRIIFDDGSQLSFISPKAREALKLQTISKHKTDIKAFSNADNAKDLDLASSSGCEKERQFVKYLRERLFE